MADNPYPNEQTLAQNALAHVRAICKGNGVKTDAVQILSHKITTLNVNAGTYLELKPVLNERTAPGKTVSGTMVNSREEATRAIDQAMISAARDPVAKAQIADALLKRADKGFGLQRQAVPIDFLKREFTWHEACSTCRGTTQTTCSKCVGRRVETCMKCTGRGLMACPLCRGTGLLQGNKCTKCFGQRYMPCDMCQRSGFMPCRTCHATGVMKCQTCGGQGWKSHILSLSAVALTYFEYEAKTLPKGAADVIETQATTLVAANKVKVEGRVADDKENVLGASYEVTFPFGEIIFTVGKKEVKAGLFGYKADLTDFPNILDKMLAGAVEELEQAANDVGSVAEKIQKATRYKLIAQAYIMASRTSSKKVIAALLKKYDIGLSQSMVEKIVFLADKTTQMITRKPRNHGLAAGLGATTLLSAIYYFSPLRQMLGSLLPDIRFDVIFDVLPIVIGGFVTIFAIQFSASKAIRKALGHLFPEDQKSKIISKTHSSGWYGFAGTAFINLIIIEITAHVGPASPYWYLFLRNLLVK